MSWKPSGNVAAEYPHLFQEVISPTGRANFALWDETPPANLIAHINLVPHIGDEWLTILLEDGSLDVPGGTLEAGEGYMDALRRELMEEAGAQLVTFQLLGAWHCVSLAEQPYRPHLPHPQFYRVVGVGEVKIVGQPENPPGGEKVIAVESAPLESIVARFVAAGRYDLAELYQLASQMTQYK